MKRMLRIYCIACGLLVGPACLAVILALVVGVLPEERMKAALAMISTDTPLQGILSATSAPCTAGLCATDAYGRTGLCAPEG